LAASKTPGYGKGGDREKGKKDQHIGQGSKQSMQGKRQEGKKTDPGKNKGLRTSGGKQAGEGQGNIRLPGTKKAWQRIVEGPDQRVIANKKKKKHVKER